ncbi:hypothetical protein TeGR_g9351 [Tetraparma gracilis]|uniref:MYND-type domain-containing protein n=1 Tax=Tetraparma gracilis TaxID=2962635 RepID=A0ABQ6M7H8_9STRA|nr:hypothetical protein TeGR_g9351 [Tetraparma gracilis]
MSAPVSNDVNWIRRLIPPRADPGLPSRLRALDPVNASSVRATLSHIKTNGQAGMIISNMTLDRDDLKQRKFVFTVGNTSLGKPEFIMRNVPRTMATQAQDALRSVAGLLQRGVDVAENHGVYGGNLRCIVAKPSAAEAEALRSEFFGTASLIYGDSVEILELLPMCARIGCDLERGERLQNPEIPVRLDNLRGCSQCSIIWDVSAGAKTAKPKVCGGCSARFYCDKRCQKLHWRDGHKEECTTLAKMDEDLRRTLEEREAADPGGEKRGEQSLYEQGFDQLFSSQPLVQFIRAAIWAFSPPGVPPGGIPGAVLRLGDGADGGAELVRIGCAFRSDPPWTVMWTNTGALSEEEHAFLESHRLEFARLYE